MANQTKKAAVAKKSGGKALFGALAVVCAGGAAGFMFLNAQAKEAENFQMLIAQAQETSISNVSTRSAELYSSLMTSKLRATALSSAKQESQEVLDVVFEEEIKVEIDEKAAAEAAAAAAEAQAKINAMYNTGSFDPSIYGYSAQDKLAYWKNINSDTTAYLYIPGTNISHAVVQDNTDVNYYTSRGYYKESSYYGVLWSPPGTTSNTTSANLSDNTVIFGHNWTNISNYPRIGSSSDIMFGQLTGYHHTGMAKSFPYIYYSTSQEVMVFKIFACYYSGLEYNYIQVNGNNSGIVADALSRSRHTFDVDVNGSDKLLTLSTCTRAYGSSANQRFVVVARLLRAGESVNDEVNVTYNPNHKQPTVY